MALELETDKAICCRCGTAYGRRKGNFPVCYATLYKGTGFIPYCKNCIDTLYNDYYKQSNDAKKTVRQMCRKLDLFWNEQIFDAVEKKASKRALMTNYITRINNIGYAGKSYDDTLSAEGTLWAFTDAEVKAAKEYAAQAEVAEEDETALTMDDIDEHAISYWGPGYTPDMYQDLEQRRNYWINNLPDGIVPDIGMEALIRQICNLEIDINRARAEGKPVDKQIGVLDKLISSMNLKPGQKTDDNSAFDKTPFGVWIDRWEYKRPIPEPDPELDDYDGIIKKITTWFLGHICAMFGFKNKYCKLYEDKIASLRIEREDTEDDDDEEVFNTFFGGNGDDG